MICRWRQRRTGHDGDNRVTGVALVFRDDAGLADDGIFLNWVNFADLNNGGGKVLVDSVEQTFTPIDLVSARPTISH